MNRPSWHLRPHTVNVIDAKKEQTTEPEQSWLDPDSLRSELYDVFQFDQSPKSYPNEDKKWKQDSWWKSNSGPLNGESEVPDTNPNDPLEKLIKALMARKRKITENEKPKKKDPTADSTLRKNTNKNLAEEDFESNIMSLFGSARTRDKLAQKDLESELQSLPVTEEGKRKGDLNTGSGRTKGGPQTRKRPSSNKPRSAAAKINLDIANRVGTDYEDEDENDQVIKKKMHSFYKTIIN